MKTHVAWYVWCSALLWAGCGSVTYLDEAFPCQARKHEVVAILPFEVDILYPTLTAGDITPATIEEMEADLSGMLQEAFHSQFLRRYRSRHYTVRLLDPRKTNALLEARGIAPERAWKMDASELAGLLDVDAVLLGYVQMEKPLPEVMAAVAAVIFGAWLPTNEISARLSLYEGEGGTLVWRFERQLSGSVTASVESLMRALVRSAARKFPYQPTYLDCRALR